MLQYGKHMEVLHMTKAVRYFSRLGNTKTIAEAIAEGAGRRRPGVRGEGMREDGTPAERID